MDKDQDKLLRKAFSKIKEEAEEHLTSINENTDEINVLFDYIFHLESKISKLEERIDYLELEKTGLKEKYRNIVLTPREQEVFLVLYTRDGNLIDFKGIARNLGYTEEMISEYLESILKKGVPIIKRYKNNTIYLALDSDFRNLQAKENVVKVNETLSNFT